MILSDSSAFLRRSRNGEKGCCARRGKGCCARGVTKAGGGLVCFSSERFKSCLLIMMVVMACDDDETVYKSPRGFLRVGS